jgi:CBS domain-containing protein
VTELTAKDVMTKRVLTIQGDALVSELVSLLSENMITGAPVVDSDGKIVGVVSTTDVARQSAKRSFKREHTPDFYLHGWELIEDDIHSFSVEEESDEKVQDIMTPVIFSVSENATISEMADTMVGGRIHRLIVTAGDAVVGIVTTLDLLKAFRRRR